jgi:hypothetical protein
MAVLTKAAFLSKWSTLFADNSIRSISEQDMRDFREDIADSFINSSDSSAVYFGGEWSFPGGNFPTSINSGTIYIAATDHGSLGDPDYVSTGTWFISLVNGANSYAQYSYKL